MKNRFRLLLSLLIVIAGLVAAGMAVSNLNRKNHTHFGDAGSAGSQSTAHRSPNFPLESAPEAPRNTSSGPAMPATSTTSFNSPGPQSTSVFSQPNQRQGAPSQELTASKSSQTAALSNGQSSAPPTNSSTQGSPTSTSLVAFSTTGGTATQIGGAPAAEGLGTSSLPGASQENAQPAPEPEVVSAEPPELNIPVPPGAIAPAVFYDQEPRSPQQTKVLDRIAKEFQQDIAEPAGGLSSQEVWETARYIADWKYQTFFGYAAYNEKHLQSAKEAVKERRSLQTDASAGGTTP